MGSRWSSQLTGSISDDYYNVRTYQSVYNDLSIGAMVENDALKCLEFMRGRQTEIFLETQKLGDGPHSPDDQN